MVQGRTMTSVLIVKRRLVARKEKQMRKRGRGKEREGR
jgi:hypothetical protein